MEGLSRTELAAKLKKELSNYLKNPDRDHPVFEFQGNRVGRSESSRELQGE